MNFAGVFRTPLVFLCQNNHWSISMPIQRQTASGSIAVKATAYGFPGIKVDGNSVEEVYGAAADAVDRARRGEGPTLIEAETYRLGAHSSSDDPTRYRDPKEVEAWKARDPLEQFRARLIQRAIWTEERDRALKEELLQQVNAAIDEAEKKPPPGPETLFDDVYASDPWNIAEQRQQLLAMPRDPPNTQ